MFITTMSSFLHNSKQPNLSHVTQLSLGPTNLRSQTVTDDTNTAGSDLDLSAAD